MAESTPELTPIRRIADRFDLPLSTLHYWERRGLIRPCRRGGQRCYTPVAALLRPGGWFFNLDLVLDVALAAPTAPLTAIHRRLGGDREDQHRHHDHHDPDELHPAGLTDHLRWLTEAGFDNVDCPRKELSEVFLVAQRPASR